jgi:hypothetical protein
MAPQPTRTVLTTAGVGTAALLLAAAAAVPAFADGHDDHGNNGNHYGQTKDHANDGAQSDSTTGHNPPGNNGTVKIHDDYGDTAHHNVPHVDCDFAVAFWGFDQGQTMDVSFAGQAPTGMGTTLTVTGATTSITSPDDAGGGQDYDGELDFRADQLDLASLGTPHPKQGYHVKLTVVTGQPDANPTAGHKYKVFWLQPCTQPAGTTTAPATATTETANTDTANTDTTEVAPTAVNAGESSGAAESAASTDNATGIPTEVLGRSITRGSPASAAAPAASSLPFTGAEIGGLAAAAAIALAGGTALTVAGRRRRHGRSLS